MANETIQRELWHIIDQNMGRNSLVLFQQFYEGEKIKEQIEGAQSLFADLFGKEKAAERLQPIVQKLGNQEGRSV